MSRIVFINSKMNFLIIKIEKVIEKIRSKELKTFWNKSPKDQSKSPYPGSFLHFLYFFTSLYNDQKFGKLS